MRKTILILALAALLVSACGGRGQTQPTAQASPIPTEVPPTATLTPSPLPPTFTPEPTVTSTPVPLRFPVLAIKQAVACRMGPDTHYNRITNLVAGGSVQVNGRSVDSAWFLVQTLAPQRVTTCWAPAASLEVLSDTSGLALGPYPPLPDGPTNITATGGVCGVTFNRPLWLYWTPVAQGVGYRIYRNGSNIATVYGGSYIDRDTPKSAKAYVYTYVIEAFNAAGVSINRASVSVTICGK